MAGNLTADQVRAEHLAAFGSTLGPTFHELYDELCWLHVKWRQYCELFAESPERIKLLNSSAWLFFRVTHDVLWHDVLLHIAKLTDPARLGRHENLSFRRLPELIRDPLLADKVSALIDDLVEVAEFARPWRDKKIAHLDYEHAVDPASVRLDRANRENVEAALEMFRTVLNTLLNAYGLGTVLFERISGKGDADSLVWHLKAGTRFEELHLKCDLGHPIRSEDFRQLPQC